jgi:hypothetical protein
MKTLSVSAKLMPIPQKPPRLLIPLKRPSRKNRNPSSYQPFPPHSSRPRAATAPRGGRREDLRPNAGIAAPATVQGRDFTALLDDPKRKLHEAAYSRFLNADAVITVQFIHTSFTFKGKDDETRTTPSTCSGAITAGSHDEKVAQGCLRR